MARYGRTTNGILRSLIVGYLATALVLLDRTGSMPEGVAPEQRTAWIALRDQHANLMAR